MTTVANLVDYVMLNRRGKAFVDWMPSHIADEFVAAAERRLLIYVESNGVIDGVAHGIRYSNGDVFVTNILTTKKGALQQILRRFKQLYPKAKLEARRHGKLKHYNTPRLIEKLKV